MMTEEHLVKSMFKTMQEIMLQLLAEEGTDMTSYVFFNYYTDDDPHNIQLKGQDLRDVQMALGIPELTREYTDDVVIPMMLDEMKKAGLKVISTASIRSGFIKLVDVQDPKAADAIYGQREFKDIEADGHRCVFLFIETLTYFYMKQCILTEGSPVMAVDVLGRMRKHADIEIPEDYDRYEGGEIENTPFHTYLKHKK